MIVDMIKIKNNYESPSIKVYNKSEAVNKVIQLINESTDGEILNTFSNWINDNIKRCMDVADLAAIMKDIDTYNEVSDSDNLPELNWYTKRQVNIDLFISITEEKVGKRLNYDDFFKIPWICDSINIIKPNKKYKNKISNEKKFKDIWFSNIITAIRNSLMHNRYIIKRDGMYIHSEKAYKKRTAEKDRDWNYIMQEEAFEAIIPFEFFLQIIIFCMDADRKPKTAGFVIDNIDRKKWFDANKDKIRRSAHEAPQKWDIYEPFSTMAELIMDNQVENKNLSIWQKTFLSEYFKIHKFNRKNLEFTNKFMAYDDNRIQLAAMYQQNKASLLDQRDFFIDSYGCNNLAKWMMEWFTDWDDIDKWRIWRTNEDIEKEINRKLGRMQGIPDQIFSIYKNYEAKRYIWKSKLIILDKILPLKVKEALIEFIKYFKIELLLSKDIYSNSFKREYRRVYLKALYLFKFYVNNPKLELAQPQKRVWKKYWKQWRDYIMNMCKKNPKSYRSSEVKKAWIDKIFTDYYRTYLFKQFTSWDIEDWIITCDNDEIEDYINNNRDYLIFNTSYAKKLSPEQKQILDDNIRKVITERKEKLDTITIIWEEEHIRNAFAHHHYTILPWFNKILLWDPSIDDTPNREKVYNLDELYENAVSRAEGDFLDIKAAA